MTQPPVEEKPTVAKAVIAGVTALGGLLVTALVDGITATEYVTIVVGTIVAAASVWAVSNKR
jgi:positive regulator of sigma E activity